MASQKIAFSNPSLRKILVALLIFCDFLFANANTNRTIVMNACMY